LSTNSAFESNTQSVVKQIQQIEVPWENL